VAFFPPFFLIIRPMLRTWRTGLSRPNDNARLYRTVEVMCQNGTNNSEWRHGRQRERRKSACLRTNTVPDDSACQSA
jgi:hypothetical protein